MFLEILQNPQENTCASFFLNKVADLRPATLFKKRLWHRCFPANSAKFLRTLFLQNTFGRLLLQNFSQEILLTLPKFLEGGMKVVISISDVSFLISLSSRSEVFSRITSEKFHKIYKQKKPYCLLLLKIIGLCILIEYLLYWAPTGNCSRIVFIRNFTRKVKQLK